MVGSGEEDVPRVFLKHTDVGEGNQPPWKNENKAKYSKFDSKRAQKYFGVNFETPPFFPILSLLVCRYSAVYSAGADQTASTMHDVHEGQLSN
jgi:2-hydroxychromene-2-carboxylate isomerase